MKAASRAWQVLIPLSGLWLPALPPLLGQSEPPVELCALESFNIDDNQVESGTLDVRAAQEILDVEIRVDISHTWIGELRIEVEAPAGTVVRLHDLGGLFDEDIRLTWSDSGIGNGFASYTCECLMEPSGPGVLADFAGAFADGTWTFAVEDLGAGDEGEVNEWCLLLVLAPPPPPFLRGDADADGTVSAIPDARFLLDWQFHVAAEPPCLDAADSDDDGTLFPLVDALYLLRWQFLDGAEPPAPGPEECGDDPSSDPIRCESEPSC